ncbi:hypothetical protein TSUD_321220 [Trifolium subterraneum]|uniref:Uncharacterized protein n=1 Tax=Trifolium subterraneum TaxID=3900 RepID=A0A2Z6MPQ7_TRISU|nr:hypothetical protein TSUD_321220 [Trifolium subterraneum]
MVATTIFPLFQRFYRYFPFPTGMNKVRWRLCVSSRAYPTLRAFFAARHLARLVHLLKLSPVESVRAAVHLGQPYDGRAGFLHWQRGKQGGGDPSWVPEMGWADGEWTVVKRRSRKEQRQADRGFDGERQQRQHIVRSTSILRHSFFHDRHRSNQQSEYDQYQSGRSRFGRFHYRSRPLEHRYPRHGNYNCDTRMDMIHQDDDVNHHQHARRISRSPAIPVGNRQQHIGSWENRDIRRYENAPTMAGLARQERGCIDSLGTELKRYVSFYFTNFPAQLSHFYLRRGFEVSRILEDVYVAKKLNKFGAPYGFVKFSNVRDINKLSKALNVVYFGHYRVHARVAGFNRNEVKEVTTAGTVKEGRKEGSMGPVKEVTNIVENGKAGVDTNNGDSETTEDVREAGLMLKKPTMSSEVAKKQDDRITLRNFRTKPDNVRWVQNGLVETIINGEAISIVQNRITDAGFHDLIIITMGADKVFIRSASGADVLTTINSAKDFFHTCFFELVKFLRADSVSANRDRLDFAPVLLATPDLEIINRVEKLLVDGSLSGIKIHIEPDERRDVNMEVGNLVDELVEDDDFELQENHGEHLTEKKNKIYLAKEGTAEKEMPNDHLSSPSGDSDVVATSMRSDVQRDCRARDITDGIGRHEGPNPNPPHRNRTNSCPPVANRSVLSGPWNLEWMDDLNQRDAGVIFTASKRLKKGGHPGARQQKEGKQDLKRTKAGGLLRHLIHSLKKVARLLSKDRNEVLHVLTKNVRRHRGGKDSYRSGDLCHRPPSEESTSSASANNDWKHWVVMQGDNEAAKDDVRGFGKALGLRFQGDSENNFSVLSRTRKDKQVSSGQAQGKGKGASKEKDYERRSVRGVQSTSDHIPFNQFIDDNTLVDLPLTGRKFTWFKGDGLSMSRLDRFLLSEDWCLTWPNCNQEARMRGVSDHCPIIMSADEEDWDHRPSRMLKCQPMREFLITVLLLVSVFVAQGRGRKLQDVVSHFAAHFKATNVDRAGVEDVLFKTLNQVECSSLVKPFTRDEGRLCSLLRSFIGDDKLTKGLNSTFVSLMPKVDIPQCLNDFRPISLVGCLYKILAKVLANRLRLVIGSVISESHTAFVKDRQIIKGILIANEVVDEARSPTNEFPLERGLQEGDPLSPFLFPLAVEGLNVLMKTMVERNLFTGYSVDGGDSISISHLQFADDTLLLGAKIWANVRALQVVLLLFESMSGLKVNFNKSMLVGVNIPESWLGEAASALRCRVGKIPFIYLGLPVGEDPRRLVFWEPVFASLKNCLSGWKSRFLSFGGRLILIKSVLTSLPVYTLSFFKAPSCIISSIESLLIKNFLGGLRIQGKLFGLARILFVFARSMERGTMVSSSGNSLWDGLRAVERWREEGVFVVEGDKNQSCTVDEMALRGWGVGGEAWVWRRPLRGWEEEMLGECQTLLLTISVQVVLGGVALLCNSFGLLAFGLYGMSETLDYSGAQQIHYSTCWTRSRIFPIGG